jgi:hypothetical protein
MSALLATKDYVPHVDLLIAALLLNQLISKTAVVLTLPSTMTLPTASMVANMLIISQLEVLLSVMFAGLTFAVKVLTTHAMYAQDVTRVCALIVDQAMNKSYLSYLKDLF